jgi:hypothetical protein
MDRKLAKEVDDAIATLWQTIPKHKRREDHAQDFLQRNDYLHLVELDKFGPHLIAVQSIFPVTWLVVCEFYRFCQGYFWVVAPVTKATNLAA